MLSTSYESPPRRWPKAFVPLSLGIAILCLVVAVIVTQNLRSIAPALSVQEIVPATAWTVHIATDRGKGAQNFGGSVAPGGAIYVPQGVNFKFRAVPFGASGMFVDSSPRGEWGQHGGEMKPCHESSDGCIQECRAPNQPGLYQLGWREQGQSSPAISISVMVLTRAESQLQGDKTLLKVNGKSIGAYADPDHSSVKRVRENPQQYQIPKFFATLTPETLKLRFGEDFELGQLVAFKDYRNAEGRKVYTTERHTDVVPLRMDLIDKLIKLRARLQEKGVKVTRFWITSGFRTPDYNRSIGGATFSRHCYGDAADICIDEDGDKRMDDLNGDGRIDRKDGIVIGNACRELELEGAVVPGGIGVYEWDGDDSVRSHVHVDCRGFVSRWGQDGAGRSRKSFIWWPKGEFQDEDGGE